MRHQEETRTSISAGCLAGTGGGSGEDLNSQMLILTLFAVGAHDSERLRCVHRHRDLHVRRHGLQAGYAQATRA